MLSDIIEQARETILLESQALIQIASLLNDSFEQAVISIANSKGRLIISGIGKSALIGQKMVATFNSTGTPALFMHAADAIHGDLGMIQSEDIVLLISKSGESPEIKFVVPFIQSLGNTIIGMVGNMNSYLAQSSKIVLNTTVDKEACLHNLAPTCSTTAQLAMGDALSIALMRVKGFQKKDFAKYHPGGYLGKQLYLQAKDLMNKNQKPTVYLHDSIKKVIIEISASRLGMTAVLNEKEQIIGIITDGDMRRMLEKNMNIASLCAKDITTYNPKMVEWLTPITVALQMMQENQISCLLVMEENKYIGVLHLHDILNEGIS